jgi:hypothetical protein
MVIQSPRRSLIQDLIAHHGSSGHQAQESNLSEPAKKQTRIFRQIQVPAMGALIMGVLGIGQGDPDVQVREKE